MLTVKHAEYSGVETTFLCANVRYVPHGPGFGPCILCWTDDTDERTLTEGNVYVMNDAGKTIDRYILPERRVTGNMEVQGTKTGRFDSGLVPGQGKTAVVESADDVQPAFRAATPVAPALGEILASGLGEERGTGDGSYSVRNDAGEVMPAPSAQPEMTFDRFGPVNDAAKRHVYERVNG